MSRPGLVAPTPIDLTCGHQRRVDPGIASLIASGVIEELWCLTCSTDRPTAVPQEVAP